jgi:hypothetical protein
MLAIQVGFIRLTRNAPQSKSPPTYREHLVAITSASTNGLTWTVDAVTGLYGARAQSDTVGGCMISLAYDRFGFSLRGRVIREEVFVSGGINRLFVRDMLNEILRLSLPRPQQEPTGLHTDRARRRIDQDRCTRLLGSVDDILCAKDVDLL